MSDVDAIGGLQWRQPRAGVEEQVDDNFLIIGPQPPPRRQHPPAALDCQRYGFMAEPLMLGGARCLDASRGWRFVCVDWICNEKQGIDTEIPLSPYWLMKLGQNKDPVSPGLRCFKDMRDR